MKEQKTLGDLSKSLRTTDRSARLEHFGMNKFELPDGIKGISCGAYLEYDEVKEEAIKLLKEFYDPNKTTMEVKHWINFFNINEKDLIKLNLKI